MANEEPPRDFLQWLGIRSVPDFSVARPLGYAFGAFLLLASIALFFGSILAAVTTLYRAIFVETTTSGAAGVATLIVAIIGGPFLVWRTIIAHRTLGFQKEGHITDRISKAVEQLGAEKTIKKQLTNKNGSKLFHEGEGGELNFKSPVMHEETAPNIEVRIGGLLSLERIAQDSVRYDNGRDHVRVMEILCAYIRHNSPAKSAVPNVLPVWRVLESAQPDFLFSHRQQLNKRFGWHPSGSLVSSWVDSLPPPREDIALAIKILGRRTEKQRLIESQEKNGQFPNHKCSPLDVNIVENLDKKLNSGAMKIEEVHDATATLDKIGNGYSGYRIDLRGSNLQGLDFSNGCFNGALFERCVANGASFEQASLQHTSFLDAKLDGSNFHKANLSGTNFGMASLESCDFGWAKLLAADLTTAKMNGVAAHRAMAVNCQFSGAELEATSFLGSFLMDCEFHDVDFSFSDLSESCIVNCSLTAGNFVECKLGLTSLTDCWVSQCSFIGANGLMTALKGSKFSKVDLRSLSLTHDHIESAHIGDEVQIPTDLFGLRPNRDAQ